MALLGQWFGASSARAMDAAPSRPSYPKKLSDAEIDAIFARSNADLQAKTAAHNGTWRMDGASWDVDLDAGTITFTNERRWKVRAPVQVIGTRSLADGTWLWAWDHPSVPPPRAEHARIVRAFGEAQGLERLTTRKIVASEDEGWEMTALATYLAAANGAYRGPAGNAEVFMTFGEIEIAKG
jgi:hypothetical protein